MEFESRQRPSVLGGVDFSCLRERRREVRFKYAEGRSSRRPQRGQGRGGDTRLMLAAGPLELVNLRPFPPGVCDMTVQFNYWELV